MNICKSADSGFLGGFVLEASAQILNKFLIISHGQETQPLTIIKKSNHRRLLMEREIGFWIQIIWRQVKISKALIAARKRICQTSSYQDFEEIEQRVESTTPSEVIRACFFS